jgi:hypothetical protein
VQTLEFSLGCDFISLKDFAAIVYVLRTGIIWNALPREERGDRRKRPESGFQAAPVDRRVLPLVVQPVPAYRGQILENRSLVPCFSGFGGGDDNLEQRDGYLQISTYKDFQFL